MNISKPKGYNDIQAGDYESLKPGGHKCVIKQVEAAKSSKGNDMLIIYLDTSEEDFQPQHFANRYLNDKRPDKQWPGTGKSYITLSGEYGPANLKRFCTAVEHSNEGFSCWDFNDNLRIDDLKNQKVGVIFREEEYTKEDYTLGRSIKPFRFCNYNEAFDKDAPEPKLLTQKAPEGFGQTAPDMNSGFMSVPDNLEDEGLPFK